MLTNLGGDRQRGSADLLEQLDRFRRNCDRQRRIRETASLKSLCFTLIVGAGFALAQHGGQPDA